MHFVEDILDRVEARMNFIRTSNGYEFPVNGNIKRANPDPPKNRDYPFINLWSDGFDSTKDAYGRDQHLVRIYIEARAHTREEPFVNVCSRLAKDIHAALHRTSSAPNKSDSISPDLDESVEDLSINSCEFMIGEGGKPFCAVLLSYGVTTYTAFGDFETHGPNVGMEA